MGHVRGRMNDADQTPSRWAIWGNLSRRLLLLTVVFVMVAEVLIFVPSVARFRYDYLQERLEKAQIASLAALAATGGAMDPELEAALLEDADVFAVALQREESRALMLARPLTGPAAEIGVAETFDLRDVSGWTLLIDALACAFAGEARYVRVIGNAELLSGERLGAQHVEVVVDESALKAAMLAFGVRIFQLSLVISIITAGLVFLSLNRFVMAPMRRVIDGIVQFRGDPENPATVHRPSGASGELAQAEAELARTQREVQAALRQKSRLAALGEAVAKINHDLRNILASAQLFADRLEGAEDPVAARVGPKLIGALDRAIRLCQQTLEFGRAEEAPPAKESLDLRALGGDVGAALGLTAGDGDGAGVRFENRLPADLDVRADPDQLFRILLNIARNAVQAMESRPASAGGGAKGGARGDVLAFEARVGEAGVEIDVIDTGPGLPESAKAHLFTAFKGSTRRGGSGLGLAIAADLARAHGGALALAASGPEGARFRLSLPLGDLVAREAAS